MRFGDNLLGVVGRIFGEIFDGIFGGIFDRGI